VIVCPSSCGGSVEFKNGAGLDLRDADIVVAETSTLPYAVRLLEPGKIRIFNKLKGGLFLAAVPAKNTGHVLQQVRDVYPAMSAARNILQTSLQNGNPVIHPTITLMNVALIERTRGDFDFYHEGVTPAVGRLIEAVDKERVAIGKKLGVEVIPDPELGVLQGYMKEATYDDGFITAPGLAGVRAQSSLDYRYFNEDVGVWFGVPPETRGTDRGGHTGHVGGDRAGFFADEARLCGGSQTQHGNFGTFK